MVHGSREKAGDSRALVKLNQLDRQNHKIWPLDWQFSPNERLSNTRVLAGLSIMVGVQAFTKLR